MKFISLMYGAGDGCDYTIDCNKTFECFDAVSYDEAKLHVRLSMEDYGGIEYFKNIQLFCVDSEIIIPFEQWENELEEDQVLEEKLRLEEQIKELQQKLEKM